MSTRKGFLAASGATLAALASPATSRAQPTKLDAEFVRRESPPISLRHPRGWQLSAAREGLVDPLHLVTLSTRPLADAGLSGSRFDLSLFPRKAVVLGVLASPVIPGETDLSNAHPLDAGVRYADLDGGTTDDSGTGFRTYGQWYVANGFVYMVFLWIGPEAKEWDAMKAVVDTIELAA